MENESLRQILFFTIYLFCALAHFFAKTKKEIPPRLEPLLFAKSITKIKYSKQPVLMDHSYEELSVNEFLPKCGIKYWTDSIFAKEGDHLKIKRQMSPSVHVKPSNKPLLKNIEARLLHPLESLVICEINEEVGKGLFLAPDAEPLSQGTVLGIYAGEFLLKKEKKRKHNPYLMSLQGAGDFSHQKSPRIDALEYGNSLRFMQDLPSEEELNEYSIPKELRSEIATENVMAEPIFYKRIPIIYFSTLRDIHPGEQIGFSYRGDYWINTLQWRRLFDKQGNVVARFSGNAIERIQ